jgi:broad specificity phosphatase PhoE
MQLYIIRHAQSANNVLIDETQRTHDPILTEIGRQQAEILAQHLFDGPNHDPFMDPRTGYSEPEQYTGIPITHLYCSAMHRSLQTASPVAQALGLPVEIWLELHEHGGIYLETPEGITGYGGRTRREIVEEFPGFVLPETLTDDGWYDVRQGKETRALSYGRAAQVAVDLRKRAKAEPEARIALITHGTFIDSLLKALFNQLPATHMYYLHYNTAITRIDFRDDDRMLVRHVNRVDHLPPDLIT